MNPCILIETQVKIEYIPTSDPRIVSNPAPSKPAPIIPSVPPYTIQMDYHIILYSYMIITSPVYSGGFVVYDYQRLALVDDIPIYEPWNDTNMAWFTVDGLFDPVMFLKKRPYILGAYFLSDTLYVFLYISVFP